VLGAVGRQAEVQVGGTGGLGDLAHHVALRPHRHRVPAVDRGTIHRKAVAMLGHRHDIACAGTLEQGHPRCRIEALAAKLRNEILVAGDGLIAIRRALVHEIGVARHIHVARVPFAARGRHRIDAPMDEYPELGVAVPFRHAIARQGRPVCLEPTAGHFPIHSGDLRGRRLGIGRNARLRTSGCRKGGTPARVQASMMHDRLFMAAAISSILSSPLCESCGLCGRLFVYEQDVF
jgi:hypothetical protein